MHRTLDHGGHDGVAVALTATAGEDVDLEQPGPGAALEMEASDGADRSVLVPGQVQAELEALDPVPQCGDHRPGGDRIDPEPAFDAHAVPCVLLPVEV